MAVLQDESRGARSYGDYCVYHMRRHLTKNDFTVKMSQKFRNSRRAVAVVGDHFRNDALLVFNVHHGAEFTLSSMFTPSVLVNLYSGTVDHNVRRTALTVYFEERFRTFAKGCTIGNSRFLNFEEGKYVPSNPSGASIGR